MEENILVRIGADLSQLTRGIKKATRDVNKFAKETMTISQALNSFDKTAQTSFKNIDLKNVNAEFREASKEITAMKNVLRLAELKGVMPFKKQMLDTQKKMYGLSGAMGNLNATNREFMSTVKQLGAEYKKAHDGMIKANKMLGVSMIQTAGRMMNMTTQAKRISENYARMANPMYKVNAAGLAIANTMNKIANNGNAAVLSLKMLGPNANMKQLVDMQRMINQGLMRFQAVALAASITGVIFYGSLHKAAMKANKEYAKAFKDMTANLKKAFEPMVQVFAQVMIPVFNFINALAKMTIAFNKAHPTMAKILQGILLLIPALTLLLSPLAIGIGLINGMAAAFGSLWMIIGPLITGMAAMSGTVLLVAAAVVGLTAGITALWKKNEGFRNAVISAWDKIKAKAQEVFGFIPSLIDTAAQKLSTLKDAIVAAFSGDFSQLTAIFSQILPSIIAMLVGGIPGLIITAARFLPAIAQGIQQTLPTLLQTISQIIISAVSFIAQYLPMFVQTGVTVLTNLIAGLTQALPLIVSAALTVITTLITTIANALPNVISAGVTILTSLLSGITQMLPSLVNTALQIIITIVNAVVSNLPKIIDAGIKILNALINGIVSILPKLIAAGVTLIVSLVVALVNNLPKILSAGAKILTTLINGIIKVLPQLIAAIPKIIVAIVSALIKNLPQIIAAGGKILLALITGILKLIPQLLKIGPQLVSALAGAVIKSVPRLVKVGADLIRGLWNGIKSVKNWILSKIGGFVDSIVGGIKKFFGVHSPSRVMRDEVGRWIPAGLIDGINRMKSDVIGAAQQMAKWATPDVPAVSISYATPNGIRGSLDSAVRGTVDVDSRDEMLAKLVTALSTDRPIVLNMDGYTVAKGQAPYLDVLMANNTELKLYMKGVSR